MKKIESKEAKRVRAHINEMLEDWMPYLKSITSDNGKEFADHQKVSDTLKIDYYFTHPFHSWERDSCMKLLYL